MPKDRKELVRKKKATKIREKVNRQSEMERMIANTDRLIMYCNSCISDHDRLNFFFNGMP